MAFKVCPMCGTQWQNQDAFLDDQTLEINGYQADFEKLEDSIFYFTHKVEGCFTTMAIQAKDFLNLYSGKRYSERRTGLEDCPGYCSEKEQLDRCDALCECAFNREVIQVVRQRQGNTQNQ